MREKDKTKEQLIVELHELCQRLAESEETKEESKRAEEALRESERRYREFFATSRDCVFITSKAGKWIDFNDAAMEMFGYESREELLQVPVSDLYVNPDERTALTALIERQGYVKEHPVLLRRRDGVVIDTLITTGLRRSADGREIEYFGTIRDITERKRVEKELFESENKFKSFAENALVGVYLIQDGVFKYANPKFAQMFGYTVEECLNDMPFKKLVYAEDLAKVEEQVEKRTSGRGDFVQYTFRGVKKDGEIFHVEVHGSASLHKGRPAAIATILDITERKQAEDALRESEERFRTLYENAPVLIDGFDKDGRCILWNRECEKVFGWTIDEINSHDDPLALFYPDPDVRREVLDTVTTRP
ncbi:MAG TPA: PAS domain S-box protein, partial [Syntrophobacteraceae bacterium]|nr:PAS domain S-box protein [Syntrophobacteraceae bacterium]